MPKVEIDFKVDGVVKDTVVMPPFEPSPCRTYLQSLKLGHFKVGNYRLPFLISIDIGDGSVFKEVGKSRKRKK